MSSLLIVATIAVPTFSACSSLKRGARNRARSAASGSTFLSAHARLGMSERTASWSAISGKYSSGIMSHNVFRPTKAGPRECMGPLFASSSRRSTGGCESWSPGGTLSLRLSATCSTFLRSPTSAYWSNASLAKPALRSTSANQPRTLRNIVGLCKAFAAASARTSEMRAAASLSSAKYSMPCRCRSVHLLCSSEARARSLRRAVVSSLAL
jgi:hypothetical protein